MKKDVEGVIRKRNLIAKTRKTVMFWVAGASCILGAALVVSFMLIQTIMFNDKVIGMKKQTAKTLQANIDIVPKLKANVRQLNTDEQLAAVGVTPDARPIQSILDALPADENRLALGASLQQKLFAGIPGLSVDSLSVDPSADASQVQASETLPGGVKELAFSAAISGNSDSLKLALQRLEKSIRAINVKSINATSSNGAVSLQITGTAYYLPAPSLELTKKEVKQ